LRPGFRPNIQLARIMECGLNWLSIDDWWSANNKYDGDHAVYRTDGDASVNLVYHSLRHVRPRRREENTAEFIYTHR